MQRSVFGCGSRFFCIMKETLSHENVREVVCDGKILLRTRMQAQTQNMALQADDRRNGYAAD